MGTKGDTGPAGPRGYPGNQGAIGPAGQDGLTGADGAGVLITDNGDGSFTVTGSSGSVIIYNGATPQKGVDYFDGDTGDFLSFVYCQVADGSPVPPIDANSGSFDGSLELMPTGTGVTWEDTPPYTIGYTTYTSSNRYVHDITTGGAGTWSLRSADWSIPVIYSDAKDIDNKFISYVFIRDTSFPGTPVGGSFNSPNPTTAGWTDGIPSGTAPVYMSKRLFTESGNNQDLTWSVPEILGASGSGSKHQFGPTSGGPWADTPVSTDEWMIVCTQNNAGGWVCDTANPVRIKGETGPQLQGVFKAYAFKRSITPLVERPTGGNFLSPAPTDGAVFGWTSDIPTGTANLYISTTIFTSDALAPETGIWSISALFSGENAKVLTISSDASYFTFDGDNLNGSPTDITVTALHPEIAGLPVWTTTPDVGGLIDSDTFILTLAAFAANDSVKVTCTLGTYVDETTIVRLKDGTGGIDGPVGDSAFVSYVFRNEKVGVVPGTPVNGSYDGTTEVMPDTTAPSAVGLWLDDPSTPAGDEITWVSQYTFTNIAGAGWDNPTWSVPSKFVMDAVLTGRLTNESHTVDTLSDGTGGVYAGAGGLFEVRLGLVDVAAGCTFVEGVNTGTVAWSIDAAGAYTITDLTSDSATVSVTATHTISGQTVTKIYSISKSKQGTPAAGGVAETPTAVVGGTVVNAGVGSVSLRWTFPTDSDYLGHDYTQIYRGNNTTPVGKAYGDFFADTSVSSNTSYNYYLQHVNTDGVGGPKTAAIPATTLPSYSQATNWITETQLANTLTLTNTNVIVEATNFAVYDPANPDHYPFTVTNGIVYMDDVYVRGTIEAHRIINVDVAGTEGSAYLGDVIVEGDLSLPPESITWDMLHSSYRDNLVVGTAITGGTVSSDSLVGAGIFIGDHVMGVIPSGNGTISGTISYASSVLGTSAPSFTYSVVRKLVGAGSYTVIYGPYPIVGYVKNGYAAFGANPLQILDQVVMSPVTGDYEYAVRISAQGGDWATNSSINVSISEVIGTAVDRTRADNVKDYWGTGDDLSLYHTGVVGVLHSENYAYIQSKTLSTLRTQQQTGAFGYMDCVEAVAATYPYAILNWNGAEVLRTIQSGLQIASTLEWDTAHAYYKVDSVYDHIFQIGGVEAFRIGLSATPAELESNAFTLHAAQGTAAGGWARAFRLTSGTTGTVAAHFGALGSVNTITYAFISANGTNTLHDHAGANNFRVYPTYSWTSELRSTGNVITYYSDIRLKDVIAPLTNCMEDINTWEAIRYTANDVAIEASEGLYNKDEIQIGLSAQSVQATTPEVVTFAPFDRDDNDESISGEDYLTLRYERIVPVLVGALQEKDRDIQNLYHELHELKALLKDKGII